MIGGSEPKPGRGKTHAEKASRPGGRRLRLLALTLTAAALAGGAVRWTILARRRAPLAPAAAPAVIIDPAGFDGARAFDEVRRFVALGPRDSGSEGARHAAHYLAERLQSFGLEASIDVFSDATPRGRVVFRNVLATIPGRSPNIVAICSHYDTKSGVDDGFVGANDSGSSTGLLLELARVLRDAAPTPWHTLLAFLDGEECMEQYGPHDGLHGSRRLVSTWRLDGRSERVAAALVVDMIGDRDLTVTIPRNGSSVLTALVFEAAAEQGVRDRFALARGAIIDDHVPFLEAGIPAVNIIDFEFGSAPGRNDYWHTAEDTLEKISPESLETIGRVVIRVLNAVAHPERLHRLARPASPRASADP